MKRKKGTFRLMAEQAKQRLVSGCKDTTQEKTKQKLRNVVHDAEKDIIYHKICKQIEMGNRDNLLTAVLEKEHMATLDELERQRYVFNMSARVQEHLAKYPEVERSMG